MYGVGEVGGTFVVSGCSFGLSLVENGSPYLSSLGPVLMAMPMLLGFISAALGGGGIDEDVFRLCDACGEDDVLSTAQGRSIVAETEVLRL